MLSALTCMTLSPGVLAENWQAINDPEALKSLVSDTVMEATLSEGVKATATYKKDGSGQLKAWGETFVRKWSLKDNNQLCFSIDDQHKCFSLEKSADTPNLFRAKNTLTGELFELSIKKEIASSVIKSPTTAKGGAAKPSANEMAAKLANPNSPLATLTFKFQYRQFEGDLANANKQDGSGMIFQPSLPFPLENGDTIFFRPAIPAQFSQPVFDATAQDFESESGLGDIGFDLLYSPKKEGGFLLGYGVFSVIPTASEDSLGRDTWTLGPELFLGKATKKYVVGALTSHQWNVGGPKNVDTSLTTVAAFYTYLPGGGWNVGTAPIMSYNFETEQSTIPVNLTVGKTVIWSGRPWKLSMEFNYFVEKPDSFGQEWFIGFNIAPVVENGLVSWFK